MAKYKTRLTFEEAAFIAEYLCNGHNGRQAYFASHHKCRTDASADTGASRLLKRPKVQVKLDQVKERMFVRAAVYEGIDKAYIMGKLNENLGRAMQSEPVRDHEGNETGEYTYQGSVANKAAELMGKEIGMFVNRVGDPDGKPLPAPETKVYLSGINFKSIVDKAKKVKA